jgi:hypothetical protein
MDEEISLVLARQYNSDETQGRYYVIEGNLRIYECCCIELPWLNNIHDKSCIPGGAIYDVVKISTPDHLNSFLIKDVPGRDGIMIHVGNFATGKKIDTLGCQCPGLRFIDVDGNGTPDVDGSTIAMAALNLVLPQTFKLFIL